MVGLEEDRAGLCWARRGEMQELLEAEQAHAPVFVFVGRRFGWVSVVGVLMDMEIATPDAPQHKFIIDNDPCT